MANITTKFAVGDTVFYAATSTTTKRHPCPDCLGTRKWMAKSPAGLELEFSCPRCCATFHGNNDLRLDYTAFVARVERLTIGQVRAVVGGYRAETQYMCVETGIGGGTLYNESRLFATEEEAMALAEVLARADDKIEWVAKQYSQSLELCDYQLLAASRKSVDDRESLRRTRREILIEDLREAKDMDEVRMSFESFDRRERDAA